MSNKVAIYPGSFDPFTYGHLALTVKGLEIFDRLIVAVAGSSQKKTLFTVTERREMILAVLAESLSPDQFSRVEVGSFDGLLINYVSDCGAKIILRGLRATADFEFEFQMALVNQQLDNSIQTVFLMADYQRFYVSSTMVRELASLGGDINGMVPPMVTKRLKDKFTGLQAQSGD